MAILEIERKTNVLALTSFCLSLIAIAHQFYGYLVGARIELFAPSVIVLSKYDHGSAQKPDPYLAVEASMTYANRGQLGHNDVIRRETVQFTGPSGSQVLLTWSDFLEGSTVDANNPERKIQAGIKPAGPQVVAARDAISHETRFVAFNEECTGNQTAECFRKNFLKVDDALITYLTQSGQPIEFGFAAELYGSREQIRSACRIHPRQVNAEMFRRQGWVSLNCYPSPQPASWWSRWF